MIDWPRRTLTFAGFALTDYLRSWRYLVELLAAVIVWGLFLAPQGSADLNVPQFFAVAGLFMLAQTAYTTWVVVGQGRRPEGYVVLARPLGRSGYLLGYYLASIGMTLLVYLAITLLDLSMYAATNRNITLSLGEWLLGTLPLLLDAAVVAAFVTLITPLVLTPWPRIAALALVGVGLSSEVNLLRELEAGWILVRLHELFGFVLLPLAAGFGLAVQRVYTPDSVWILVYQSAVALVLLALALFAFSRRELILKS